MKIYKKYGWLIRLLLACVLVTLLFSNFINMLLFFNKEHTCGVITEKKTVNNNILVVKYTFEVDGEKFNHSMSYSYITRDIPIDDLKKLKCVEISYFPPAPYFSNITDIRVLR